MRASSKASKIVAGNFARVHIEGQTWVRCDQYEALTGALRFAYDIADEELEYTKVGTGAEVALRHIKRKTGEALHAAGIAEAK